MGVAAVDGDGRTDGLAVVEPVCSTDPRAAGAGVVNPSNVAHPVSAAHKVKNKMCGFIIQN